MSNKPIHCPRCGSSSVKLINGDPLACGDCEWLGPFALGIYPYKRESPKISRNAQCPCGSGIKHKKCCLKLIDKGKNLWS